MNNDPEGTEIKDHNGNTIAAHDAVANLILNAMMGGPLAIKLAVATQLTADMPKEERKQRVYPLTKKFAELAEAEGYTERECLAAMVSGISMSVAVREEPEEPKCPTSI